MIILYSLNECAPCLLHYALFYVDNRYLTLRADHDIIILLLSNTFPVIVGTRWVPVQRAAAVERDEIPYP